ncbi:LCP family protein [Plantactinospora soyae]|uniref:LCP family protein required for cell wall assembly n=1 Tax=Plantactinospora soyae TaxID=1544732 RepID=A0A927LYB6_9ACTN|nr:LCP family protein [Plantactinospora soyae]MBE1484788.1 LCP family protein required for cell wall assembly [Plantactinospora soyae]
MPRWARICTIFGAVLVFVSGTALVGFEAVLARYSGAVQEGDLFGDEAAGALPEKKSDIKGPLNILLVGIDPRTPEWSPLADSIMVLHVNETLDSAYLFSMPRDLLVQIPAFPKADYSGGTEKLNAAMSHGSKVPGAKLPDANRGFELLSLTVSKLTGIERFDAGAIINFSGFQKIVDAMGGVDMYIDSNVKSEHKQPNGNARTLKPGGNGYLGPQAQYKKGNAHLKGWQALDYVRQRYGLPNGDYDRQRHQQQFVRAMADQALSKDVVTNPIKLDAVLRAAGKALIFNGRGHDLIDFGFAMRGLRSDSIQMIKLPGGGVVEDGDYKGEAFKPVAADFFDALQDGTIDTFVISHPELLNKVK